MSDDGVPPPGRRLSPTARRTVPARWRGHHPPLLEREADLAAVDAAVDRSSAGSAALVVVTGPIGSGRTALLAECARRGADRGLHVLRAAVEPPPSADGAVLLLVDDASGSDAATLRRLARRRDGQRVTTVVAVLDGAADEDTDTGAAVRDLLERADDVRGLAPLSFEAVAAVARSRIADDRADPAVLRALAEVTAGIPLLLDAIVDDVAAGPSSELVGGELERRVRECSPARLRDRMAAALRDAPPAVLAHLTALAAVGDVADDGVLGRLAGLDPAGVEAARRAARRRGLTGAGDTLRHRAVADALDSVRSAEQRRDTHLRAAALLRDCGAASDRVAEHLLALSGPAPEWAVDVLRDAAGSAGRRGDPARAIRHLRHALLGEPADGERARVLVELATQERRLDPGLALRRIVQAVPLLEPVTARAEALCRVAPLALEAAAPSVVAMVRTVAAELDDAGTADPVVRELALRLEARLRYVDRNHRAGLASACDRLDELERRPGGLPLDTPGERELACVLVHAAAVSGRRGATRVAEVARAVLAREPASPEHVHSTVGMLVTCLCMADAVDGLPAWLTVAADHARTQGSRLEEAVVRAELAGVLACAGRPDAAQEQIGLALDLADGLVDDSLLPGLVLAPVVTASHDPRAAGRILARYGSAPSVPPGLGACLQMLRARAALEAGEPEAALEYCLDAGRRFERAGWVATGVPWRLWAVEVLRRRSRPAEARVLAERELARARAWGAPTALGRALRTVGELAGREAEPLLRSAVEVLRDAGDRAELARATRALAAYLDPVRDGATADPRPPSDRVPPPAEPALHALRPGAPGRALTPSERRVAERAAGGRTNQEIAEDLEVSVRAVEKHLTAVYRKIGLTGRSALCRVWEVESDLRA